MKDWQLEPGDFGFFNIVDGNGASVFEDLWQKEAEKIFALRDSHSELLKLVEDMHTALPMARHNKELIARSSEVQERAKKLTGDSQ